MLTVAKFIVGLSLTVALAGCSSGTPIAPTGGPGAVSGSKISLSVADNGHTIQVPLGDEVEITLQTIGPGEYATPQLSSPSLRYLGMTYVSPAVPAGTTQLFRFQADAAGQASISIQGALHNPAFDVTLKIG